MRTTVIIDDEILQQARRHAAEKGISVSEVVNRALREAFSRSARIEPVPTFRMVTFGRRKGRVDHRPKDFARALEAEDEATLRSS